MAETMGYEPDEPLQGQPGASILAHACVWVLDGPLHDAIYSRIHHHVATSPAPVSDTPLGVNRRCRFYRCVNALSAGPRANTIVL